MKFRTKLALSQVFTIVMFLAVFSMITYAFFKGGLPALRQGVETKTRSCVQTLTVLVDVGIAADDRGLLRQNLRLCSHIDERPDSDFLFAAVFDTNGEILAASGKTFDDIPFERAGDRPQIFDWPDAYLAGVRIEIEGKELGSVWSAYSTHIVSDSTQMFFLAGGVALFVVLVTSLLSIFYAFHLVDPLNRMIRFVHGVASGNMDARLAVKASDELAVLVEDLNKMTIRLQHRLAVENAVFLSSRIFVSSRSADLGEVLQIMGDALKARRGYVFRIGTGKQPVELVADWQVPGDKFRQDLIEDINTTQYAWGMKKLAAGETLILSGPENLPPEASDESGAMKKWESHPSIVVPVRSLTGSLMGFMLFGANQPEWEWPNEDIEALGVVAELLASYWERARAEKELKASEEKFRMLFEEAPDAYYLNDMQGRFIDGNRAAEELTGKPKSATIGKPMLEVDMIPEEDVPKVMEGVAANLEGRPAEIDELTILKPDGSRIIVDVRAYPVTMGGQDLVLGIARDVTARVKAEKEKDELKERVSQLQKMEALGQLAGGVAHELNNPITVILGFAHSLTKRLGEDDPLAMPLASIEREALRCKNLVSDMLAFTRKPAGERTNFTIASLFEATSALIKHQANVKSVELIVECSPGLPEVKGDFNRLQQVLVNLATNAIDAMPEGGVLRFFAGVNESQIIIQVSDTGEGIPAEVLGHIFEPFFTTKEVGRGTGLGLALAFEVVQQHGGSIHCNSRVGKGTTFVLSLPAA